jgi:hypothetical protein
MDDTTKVTPQIGHYVVSTVDRWGVHTHRVGKDKRCTCGGWAEEPCRHIRAVTTYLKAGGERAAEKSNGLTVREKAPVSTPPAVTPAHCPLCNAEVVRESLGRWRCPRDPSHYFQWRGEQGIRQFLTKPHPNKAGAFYEQSVQERERFLSRINERRRT